MDRRLHPRELKELLQTTQEYAVLDVREEGAFSETHLLAASNLPLSRLEFRAPSLVPNFGARIVLMDERGEGLAERAFERLTGLGYRSLQILAGGVRAWEAEGYSVYSGVNVLSKAFGEVVYERCGTPDITAETLKAWTDAGKDMVILDSRPFSEYQEHTIPGSISMPGAELAFRVHELAADPDTAIVVNCAGRTRSIIGCQSLRNAGLANDVYCLRNGTMGWKLAGFGLETQQTRSVDTVSPAGRAGAGAGLSAACGAGVRGALRRCGRGRGVGGRSRQDRLSPGRAHAGGVRGRASALRQQRSRRTAGAGHRRVCGRAQRDPGADRPGYGAGRDDGLLADAARLAERLRARGGAASRPWPAPTGRLRTGGRPTVRR